MKAVEFESSITPEGMIALPPELTAEIPVGEQLRIVVMWSRPARTQLGEKQDDGVSKRHIAQRMPFTSS